MPACPDRFAVGAFVPHSSRGPGHRPLKAEITGSNPVCGTISQPQHIVVRFRTVYSILCFLADRGSMCGTAPPRGTGNTWPVYAWRPGSTRPSAEARDEQL